MSVSRRFIISELKNRNIHPGSRYVDYPSEILKFLFEIFNLQGDVLKEEDRAAYDKLEKAAKDISSSVRKMMNLTSGKTTVKLNTILSGSKHRVHNLYIHNSLQAVFETVKMYLGLS